VLRGADSRKAFELRRGREGRRDGPAIGSGNEYFRKQSSGLSPPVHEPGWYCRLRLLMTTARHRCPSSWHKVSLLGSWNGR